MNKRALHYIFGVIITLFGMANAAHAQRDILVELDNMLDAADGYVNVRYAHIRSYETMLNNHELSPMQQYNIYSDLYNEYFACVFFVFGEHLSCVACSAQTTAHRHTEYGFVFFETGIPQICYLTGRCL